MNLLKVITPVNLQEERQKFFENFKYNPKFNYYWQKERPKILPSSVKDDLIISIMDSDFEGIIRNAKLFFEIQNFFYLDTAQLLVNNTPKVKFHEGVDIFIESFKYATDFLDLGEYKIKVVDQFGFNFRPNIRKKEILMSKNANFQFFDAESEIAHELVHIIRYENGKYNNIKKSKNYLPTEEGLATLMQDRTTNGIVSEFQHAAEYLASKIGLEGSLRDIFEYFMDIGFDEELAWQRATRHKFGFVDTSYPGDILKPAMYFANSQKIKHLDNIKILNLFIGKISVNDLDKYTNYTGRVDETKLKKFYNLT